MTHITFVRGILTDSFLLYYIFYKFPNFDSCVGCGFMLFYFYGSWMFCERVAHFLESTFKVFSSILGILGYLYTSLS